MYKSLMLKRKRGCKGKEKEVNFFLPVILTTPLRILWGDYFSTSILKMSVEKGLICPWFCIP